jgi:very-short-patch-repair endonuclease
MKCDYGCEQEAKFQLKNGKWCCSKSQNSCIGVKKKFSLGQIGRKQTEETKLKLSIANKGKKVSEESRKKISESRKKYTGENHPLYGKPCSETRRKKISEANKEWNKNNAPIWLGRKHTEESKKKIGLTSLGRKHDKDFKERWRQRCLDGHSQTMNKAIKKISRQEIKLRNIVKELYPDCQFQYSIFNYSLDVVIPQYKIVIEYDGYYHFKDLITKEEKEYYILRRNKIKSEGWKFLRYTIFDKFPTLEEAKEKIEGLINEG